MLSWSWTPNLFTVFLSLQPASTLILSTCRLGLWVGGLVGWVGGWVGGFCGLWVLGLVGLLHVGIGILWVYGGWNTFDIFFVQILFNVLYVLVSVGWRSHTLRVTAIYCFWLFQANSLRHNFILFYLCNVLLLL